MISECKKKDYLINFYREKKFNNNILVTTDQGGWIILKEEDYIKMLKHEPEESLYNALLNNGIIINEKSVSLLIKKYKERLAHYFNGVGLHLVVPTTRCNQKCIYCHSNASAPSLKSETMNQAVADKVVDFILQSPSPNITIEFQGGESLMAFEVVKYVTEKAVELNKVKRKKLDFDIVTNLTLLTDEMIPFIKKHSIRICTSLDGPKHVHDANRRFFNGGDTYDTVIAMIEKLKRKNVPVGMLMVTTRHSLPYWKEIVDEYLRLGQSNIRLKYLDCLGFARDAWAQIGYTFDEYREFWKKSVDYIFSLNKKGVLMTESNVMLALAQLNAKSAPNFLDLRSPCGIVTGQLAYNYNGDIFSCDEGRVDDFYIMGNVKKDRYQDVLESEKARELVSASITENCLCDACVYKPFCGVCPVLNRAINKSLLTIFPNESHCNVFKYIFDYVINKTINNPQDLKRLYVGLMLSRKLTAASARNPVVDY